ncbi:Mobile element protein [Polaromonas sp. CG9_12]|nr:Mobile element protein [Polaromonas sp. CG9_12]
MLSRHIIAPLQPHDFDRLARKEKGGRRRLRLIALAHRRDVVSR